MYTPLDPLGSTAATPPIIIMNDKDIIQFILNKTLESASEFQDTFTDSMIEIVKEDIKQKVSHMSNEEKIELINAIKEQ